MNLSRSPAVAGQFYPINPQQLQDNVVNCIEAAVSVLPEIAHTQPKALIVPHAGYIYSGVVAASAYATLLPYKDRIKRVVLLGPSHHYGFRGLASSHFIAYETPLGSIRLDYLLTQKFEAQNLLQCLDQAHLHEHSLEVQLPFLQQVLDDFTLIPLVVGDADKYQVSNIIDALWGGDETLFVISSDLSHFLSYEAANEKDNNTADAIDNLEPDLIEYDDACGRNPVKGLLHSAHKHGLKARRLALCNSGDTAGDKDRVVGYGAWSFS
jgi:AmmeMemoRadiSam system protein B